MAIFIYGIFQISWHVILCYLFLEIFAEKATLTKFKKYGLEIGLIVGNYLLAFFFSRRIFLEAVNDHHIDLCYYAFFVSAKI
jgi:hypothetical protein